MPIKDTIDYKAVTTSDYNMIFNKHNGTMLRWGSSHDDDPQLALLGPEILDIEISTGDCSGKCSWCYKSNTVGNGKHMSLETFQVILNKIGKQLTQVALGITNANANPDFISIMEYARSKGVIPNFTLAGYGMNLKLFEKCSELAGAIAVSVYRKNKRLAYDMVRQFRRLGIEQTNIHLLYYQENLQFVYEVLHDVAWGKITPHAVVLLALKAKGRGSNLTPVTEKQFSDIVDAAMEDNIPLGFDSCSAPKFERWAKRNDREDLLLYSEPCESGLFSSYINVDGDFFPCSFMEGVAGWEQGISMLECRDFLKDVWFNPRTIVWQNQLINNDRRCPVFDL